MKCEVTFLVGDKEVKFDLETDQTSSLTDDDIIKVLKEDEEKRKLLSDILHKHLYKQVKLEETTVKSLTNHDGLLGNCGIEYLKSEFPDVGFPEGVEANVLLVDHLSIAGKSVYGRIINSNGQEVFIIKGTKEDVIHLSNFLRIRSIIEDLSFKFDEESVNYANLMKIKDVRNKAIKDKKISSLSNLILDYIYNRKKYEDLYIDNESAYTIMSKIVNTILQYSDRTLYADEFVNTINILIYHRDDNTKSLTTKALYGAIKNFYPEILEKLELKNKTAFYDFFKAPAVENKELLEKVFKEVNEEEDGFYTLFKYLFSKEPEYTLNYKDSSKNYIIFTSKPKTLLDKYGIEYDTINSFDIINDNYKGYKIYAYDENGTKFYIPYRYYLTEKAIAKRFKSEEEAKAFVDDNTITLSIRKNNFLELKLRNKALDEEGKPIYDDELDSLNIVSKLYFVEGSVIESIDIPLVDTTIYNGEDILFRNDTSNYNTFVNIINKWKISQNLKNRILDSIDNAEKITAFIYKVNELLNSNREGIVDEVIYNEDELATRKSLEDIILDIIDKIKLGDLNRRTYYIENRKVKGSMYSYRLIPTKGIDIELYKKNKKIPSITLMLAISQSLNDKFNVKVNLITAEEVAEKLPKVDVNTTKAFILNGEIYVNTTVAKSSDLMHEYIHLILGVLKTDPELRSNYEQLMYLLMKTEQGDSVRKSLRNIYTDMSEMDLMEETFAKLFSNYIMNNMNSDLKNIFKSLEKFIKDSTKIIFNNSIDNIKDFYGKSIETIFKRFSSDVSLLLDRKGLDFESTRQYRYKANWISTKIRENEIIEHCYG